MTGVSYVNDERLEPTMAETVSVAVLAAPERELA
jgi:hypothetical protein